MAILGDCYKETHFIGFYFKKEHILRSLNYRKSNYNSNLLFLFWREGSNPSKIFSVIIYTGFIKEMTRSEIFIDAQNFDCSLCKIKQEN